MSTFKSDVLALLEERPYTTGELAALVGLHNGRIAQICRALAQAGQVRRLPDHRWALAAHADATEPAASPALRQPHERPAMATVPKHGPGSWWVGLDRQQLAAGIAERQEQMHASRMARLVDGTVRG